ncbi:AT-rich interactive domain-containing protein 1-like [Salvia hispanica]|uniref:AT-rich interactive domain-containing protein 1-like n=1 Tax=Salvia hispanica TaxID=49212 RepID=UPI0020093830|nr:AT-rich interactive domain-containing protein 1-like [Salvia hispanica]
MAGWLKRENDTLQGAQKLGVLFDLGIENNGGSDVNCTFTKFLKAFLEDVYGISCLRSLPPVIGEGQVVDLLKLKIVVKKRGGYCRVSENGLWSSVAADCGVDLRFSAALKLTYVKYLDSLDRWLRKIEKCREEGVSDIVERYLDFSRFLIGLESDPKVFMSSKIERGDGFVVVKKREFEGNKGFVGIDVKGADDKWSNKNSVSDDVNIISKGQSIDKGSDGDDLQVDRDSISKKRKLECYTGTLNWIHKVGKDPTRVTVEPLPEGKKWKCYGSELPWKQILVIREAMLLKKNVNAGSQQSAWQKKQKMHPSMYDDDQCVSERLRCSLRVLSSKDPSQKSRNRGGAESSSSDFQTNEDNVDSPIYLSIYRKKRVPIGSNHQADLLEFQGEDYESETRWLGTKIWPLDKAEQKKKSLIERDRIGKGRQECCGCQFAGSLECVRFHIREKKLNVKLELGSAFNLWKLDMMGEDVAFSWTNEDRNKFQHTVQSNPLSSGKYFWNKLFKHFPQKGREALVSYYFNVFLLRCRANQNRTSPVNINSDDEGSGYGPIANRFGAGLNFCSPNKPHLSSR